LLDIVDREVQICAEYIHLLITVGWFSIIATDAGKVVIQYEHWLETDVSGVATEIV
jgi:hypothetical protein